MSTINTPSLADLAAQLERETIVAEEAASRVSATKTKILAAMLAQSPDSPETYRAGWAQIQPVRKAAWSYRDAAVTAQQKVVDAADKALKQAKELLKGAQNAAKAAGKAKEGEVKWEVRVVKGK